MKKTVNTSFIYAILAMAGGVFYREFTKFQGFEEKTTLSVLHTHLFMLGMAMFLLVTICIRLFALDKAKKYSAFFIIYNIGVCLTAVMLTVRGITQVLGVELSNGQNGMLSGSAGIGHILLGVGMVLFFLSLKESVSTLQK
ncbi:DUF2871 domain-containing protein [Faecalimonas canis]